MKKSLTSGLFYSVLKATNFSEKAFKTLLNNPKRGSGQISQNKLNRRLTVVESDISGFKIITVSTSHSINKHIILLHGGAYVSEALKGHRILLEKLVLHHDFKVTFIDYPLAPEHAASTTVGIVEQAFNKVAKEHPDDDLFLLGDSAGGGLALALLQILRAKNNPHFPLKTVLVSPWLDISMSNKDIPDYITKDVLLSYDGLKKCGLLYARDMDLNNPKVSPIYGHPDHLSIIKIFVSTHELFYPDCLLLKQKLDHAEGSTALLTIKRKMVHDWIVLPFRERKETIDEIAGFYKSN